MGRRGLVGGLAFFLLLAMAAYPAPESLRAQDDEQRLERVERRIADLRNQITSARTERSGYLDTISEMQARMADLKSVLGEAEAALADTESAVSVTEIELANLGRRIRLLDAELAANRLEQRLTRELIRDRAIEMYMNSPAGIDTAFFESRDLEAGAIKLEYSRTLLQQTDVLLASLEVIERQEVERQDTLREEQEAEADMLADLEAELASAQDYREDVEQARADLRDEISAQEALLAQVTAEIADHEDHVASLEAESKELELEILRRQVREGRAPGRLAWPVNGGVTSPFGWRIHPILGGRRLHTGIDQAAATGDAIRAAGNGTVILAERWGGYGRTVVIDHGGGLSSLYAHQSSIAVSVGTRVQAGDVIGYIGCSGYCTGPHLHFEVREVGTPVDPMLYLKG